MEVDMDIKMRSVFIGGAVVAAISLAPMAQAYSAHYMNPAELEQSVLRAQPGAGLGAWTQNLYFSDGSNGQYASAKVPQICPSMSGAYVTLPKANSYGMVGYAVDANTSMSITIWQYKSDSQAKAAKSVFLKTTCPDTPKVAGEDQKYYQMSGGGNDFTDSQVDGVPALQGGYSGTVDSGTPISATWAERPVGKTVIRVEAVMYGEAAKSSDRIQRANTLVKTWIDDASRAVLKFSGADPHAA
jgi:hypothetical protein